MNFVYKINQETIDNNIIEKIMSKTNDKKRVGFDMRNVKTIKSDKFIEYLLKNKIKLFNVQNEVLVYLAIILKDGFLKSYINFDDFNLDRRELIKRKFKTA